MTKIERLEQILHSAHKAHAEFGGMAISAVTIEASELEQLLAVVRAAQNLFRQSRAPEDYTGREYAVVKALAALEGGEG